MPQGAPLEIVEQAIRNTGGTLSKAAEQLGIGRSALCLRVKAHERLQKVVAEAKETRIDLAEDSLGRLVKSDNLGAVCFTLKCLGKERGYVEQAPDKPVQLNLQVNVDRLGEALRSELEHKSRAAIDIDSDPLD